MTYHLGKHSTFEDVAHGIFITKGLTITEGSVFGLFYKDSRLPLYETVSSMGFKEGEGDYVELRCSMKGGALVRKNALKEKRAKMPMTKETFECVFAVMEKCKTNQTISMKALLQSMPLPDLQTYLDYLKHGKATNKQKINAITELIPSSSRLGCGHSGSDR
eukprot:s2624_g11.t1